MTFADAVNSLSNNKAAKRAGWGGYVWRVDDATTEGKFTLKWQTREGASTIDYTFIPGTGAGTGWTAPATKVIFDADIMAAMVAEDWTIGSKDAYESARTGTGTW